MNEKIEAPMNKPNIPPNEPINESIVNAGVSSIDVYSKASKWTL